ncbi:MAG: cation diffusion facilitator family transporter [Clostridiales bacterium]|nr:cation diffusion facilitator family transporter [Clostridiales bacterium]
MITFLSRFFIREKQDKVKIRQEYGMLCGVTGILLNICLFVGKFLAGTISNSIAITADAINNLSDAGSSCVTLIGFKLAGAKPDPEHPFGHGRIEYVSGLVVAAAILLMAYELIRDSVQKIIHPEETEFSILIVAILAVSILVKIYMFYYNNSIGKKIDSAAMRATATDSLSDTCATAVVLAATLVGHFTGLHIDGYCGALVGIFIFFAGINAAKETLNPLLGQPPEEEFVEQIDQIVMAHEEVCGIHDLIVHDYGPGRQMISLHAEVPAEGNILEVHDIIDNIENELRAKLGCDATIHMDPIVTSDEHVSTMKAAVISIMKGIDEVINIHDFRVVTGPTHTNLIFDVLVPYKFYISDEELISMIEHQVRKRLGSNYNVVIKVDKAYVQTNAKK